jgi:cobaltochelatase CobS
MREKRYLQADCRSTWQGVLLLKAVTQEYKITGFIDANGKYQETQFYKAFAQGGVFMLDEMDASTPEVLVILNAAIANRYFDFPVGRVEAHPDFRIVAAGNTYGTGADIEYTGRFQLDASSLDRFAIIEVSYDKDIELAIAGGDKEVIDFVHAFRSALATADIKFTVSYRAIERLVKLKAMFDTQKAIQLAVLRGMEKDDAKMVANNLPGTCNQYINELKKMLKK